MIDQFIKKNQSVVAGLVGCGGFAGKGGMLKIYGKIE